MKFVCKDGLRLIKTSILGPEIGPYFFAHNFSFHHHVQGSTQVVK